MFKLILQNWHHFYSFLFDMEEGYSASSSSRLYFGLPQIILQLLEISIIGCEKVSEALNSQSTYALTQAIVSYFYFLLEPQNPSSSNLRHQMHYSINHFESFLFDMPQIQDYLFWESFSKVHKVSSLREYTKKLGGPRWNK